MENATEWRTLWRDLGPGVFLNFAGHAAMPRAALEAACRAAEAKAVPIGGDADDFFASSDRARASIASLVGGDANDIALTTGASAGTSLVALGRSWAPGDEILVCASDFPNHVATWSPLEAREGVRVRQIGRSGEPLTADEVIEALSPDTRMVALSHVGFGDGALIDAPPLGRACRRAGVSLLLDASQSMGAAKVDVEAIGADYIVGIGYKYLLGPWGVGFIWMSPQARAALRPGPWNWISQDVQRFADLDYVSPRPSVHAKRWDSAEMVGPFNLNLAAFDAALGLVCEITPERVLAHGRGLIDRLFAQLPATCRPVSPVDPEQRGVFGCFQASSLASTEALYRHLRARGFVVSLRGGAIRVAPHLINDSNDIDQFAAAVEQWAVVEGRTVF